MQKGSIATRLFWLSAAWLVVALIATAFLLSALYSRALDRSLADALNFNLETLVARTLEAGAPDALSVVAADPRYDRPASGWYWQIADAKGSLFNLSSSLVGASLPKISKPFDKDNTRSGVAYDSFGTKLRVIERKVTILDLELFISVSGNLDEIAALTGQFRSQALMVLGAVGAMLAVMSFIIGRVALRPIGQLRQAIEDVRAGGAKRVEGNFPSELTPLADELNELLRSNLEIVERAKNQVGNLAHGLKTPLAVLRNEAAAKDGAAKDNALAGVVGEQVEKMNSQVATYLDRARLSARSVVIGQRSDVFKLLERLVRVMKKIHPQCRISLNAPSPATIWFRGEDADLEEMIGNLLDNACKWSKSEVVISLSLDGQGRQQMVLISIKDDGKGLTKDQVASVLERGVRLDEKTPGSGLGLDIVKELVDVYGGQLSLGRSPEGGLEALLKLPALSG
ncbi:Sensor histidine kinase [hydrothermal vent metagenome]|uniref:histidine kinase n=2 Tax=hydrothermal vent metagenome TaxID=652676 RepID=A0A3B0TLK5_9ZZZZ